MNPETESFWLETWNNWGTGALSFVSNAYEEAANKPFETYLKTDLDVKSKGMKAFFDSCSPREGEFLIGYHEAKKPHFVLTNQRLWIYDKPMQSYDDIPLADIADCRTKGGWTGTVTLDMKNNSQKVYSKLDSFPVETILKTAVEMAKNQKPWTDLAKQPISEFSPEIQKSVSQTKKQIIKPQQQDEEFFAPEKKGIQKGVVGGVIMMVIAVVWFFGGLAADIIFFYPPILFVIGLYATLKGVFTGNLVGEKPKDEISYHKKYKAQDSTDEKSSVNQLFEIDDSSNPQ